MLERLPSFRPSLYPNAHATEIGTVLGSWRHWWQVALWALATHASFGLIQGAARSCSDGSRLGVWKQPSWCRLLRSLGLIKRSVVMVARQPFASAGLCGLAEIVSGRACIRVGGWSRRRPLFASSRPVVVARKRPPSGLPSSSWARAVRFPRASFQRGSWSLLGAGGSSLYIAHWMHIEVEHLMVEWLALCFVGVALLSFHISSSCSLASLLRPPSL